jgi:Ca2+-binding EF-hand superfamily protein
MGQSVEDLMTGEQIQRLLVATFNKFDADGSGQLEYDEFKQAFSDLGLNGSEKEIQEMFKKVDVDGSGYVDRVEFSNAVKSSRMAELSLNVLISQMDGKLDGLGDIFGDYKRKLESAKKQAGADLKISEENFAAFQAQTRKRKLLKRKREAKIADLCASLSKQLCEMTGTPLYTNPDEAKLYRTLRDTFNAFDRDGNAELGFPEYLEAWRFLNQPGTDEDVKKAFDGVDVNSSGLVEEDEFMYSIMGEPALKYGLMADMEKVTSMLGDMVGEYTLMAGNFGSMKESIEERQRRNAELRARLDNIKADVQADLNGLLSNVLGMNPEDLLSDEEIEAHLREAFNKFDKDGSGMLGQWEFNQAWFFLGLKGTKQELEEAFQSVDTNNSVDT